MSKLILFFLGFSLLVLIHIASASLDYKSALTKSLLYYEAQRSGKLPLNQRAQWRGDSALNDGKDAGVNLVGGYYDAGDNVKFGFPMAFTTTMLAWSVVEFRRELRAQGELFNAISALKWGTDYLIQAHPQPKVLYGQVGDGSSDHSCWQRPEDMTTPRTSYKIDERNPGSDLAGETAAGLAAAAIVFRRSNPRYYAKLITHAKQLFEFATKHTGQYQNSIPSAGQFYSSSGYEDELLWAAAWLARATKEGSYLAFINDHSGNNGGVRSRFSWDDKYIGAQVLITESLVGTLKRKYPENGNLGQFHGNAEQYICNCIQKGSGTLRRSSGGLLWFDGWNNLQYVTAASFILTAYERYLNQRNGTIRCASGVATPLDLINFARSQVDYILGSNPKHLSYMVGFGANYPKKAHHRGASIVSIKTDKTPVSCQGGFSQWFHRNQANPNVLDGAIVGGPDQSDEYRDDRENYQQAEPAIANTAPLVGVLARLSS